jgi:hypothetical protein
MDKEISMTMLLSDNPVIVESVTRYLMTVKCVFVRVADGSVAPQNPNVAQT